MSATRPTYARQPLTVASVSLLFALIALTPMCGYLFGCGCTWPWMGLARDCNYFNPADPLHCPWCDYKGLGLAAVLLTGFAAVAGSLLPEFLRGDFKLESLRAPAPPRPTLIEIKEAALRLGSGVGFFSITALLFGWLTVWLTGYPKFLFY